LLLLLADYNVPAPAHVHSALATAAPDCRALSDAAMIPVPAFSFVPML
jgi:hypothetical protein